MSDVAIRIDGLGKKYRIRHQRRDRYTALRDVITDKVRGIFRPAPADAAARVEDFWALKDASFEIKRGEVVGVIGRKGLGRMSEVAQGGRTVLFVSHNMGAIRRLTRRCIVLDGGRIRVDAPVDEAIDLYLTQAGQGLTAGSFVRNGSRPESQPFFV